MNGKLNYDRVKILLVSPDLNTRDTVKIILRNAGFRDITTGQRLGDVTDNMALVAPDLLICEAQFPDGDPCQLIHKMRHHDVGTNPFLPVIMLTWNASEDVVKKVVNSGADDLLIKPISAGQMIDRINLLVHARKPFVVTTDYIGPDRRKAPRAGSVEIPRIEVPNTLRAKATGAKETINIQKAIDETVAKVNLQKLERHAVQIGILVELILPAYENNEVDSELAGHLERLLFVSEDTSRRLGGTRYDHISELCKTLVTVTGSINTNMQNPATKDLKLLKPLSQAIQGAFNVGDEVAMLARKIAASIAENKQREKTGGGKAPAAPPAPAQRSG
jgi:DNA-binding response OmpR family regulator